MKKLAIILLVLQATTLVGCGARPNPAAAGVVGQPGTAFQGGQQAYDPNAGAGAYDPNQQFAGGGDTYDAPNYGGAGDAYGQPGGAYGQPGAADPYGQPGAGGVYDPNNPYGGGQPQIDPNTGQPIMGGINPQMDPGVSQRVVSAIQGAGGYKGLKSDNKAIEALKSMGMPMQQAFSNSPLEHRALIIKALLHGWAGSDEKNFARQIWSTVMPQDQQRLMSSDPTLSSLVTKKIASGGASSGKSGILASLGKLIGLG